MQIDTGFGDEVYPAPKKITYPTLLDLPAPNLLSYSKETTIAEKFEAMVKLKELNSRMKDSVLDFLKLVKTRKSENDSSRDDATPPAPYTSWLEYRMDNPHKVSSNWKPMTRNEAHDRKLC